MWRRIWLVGGRLGRSGGGGGGSGAGDSPGRRDPPVFGGGRRPAAGGGGRSSRSSFIGFSSSRGRQCRFLDRGERDGLVDAHLRLARAFGRRRRAEVVRRGSWCPTWPARPGRWLATFRPDIESSSFGSRDESSFSRSWASAKTRGGGGLEGFAVIDGGGLELAFALVELTGLERLVGFGFGDFDEFFLGDGDLRVVSEKHVGGLESLAGGGQVARVAAALGHGEIDIADADGSGRCLRTFRVGVDDLLEGEGGFLGVAQVIALGIEFGDGELGLRARTCCGCRF